MPMLIFLAGRNKKKSSCNVHDGWFFLFAFTIFALFICVPLLLVLLYALATLFLDC